MPQTPLTKINHFYLKREDLNTTGSAKDRALSRQIAHLVQNNITHAVISSTGNAAISAAHFCQKHNVNLTIFISPKIDSHKLILLNNYQTIKTTNPIKEAFKYAKINNCYNLRLAKDPIALLGYQEISHELIDQLPQISSIFIPTASGATLLGISQKLPKSVKIYTIQPANYCPISSYFDKQYVPESKSITDALSVRHLPLKAQVLAASYSGLVVQNNEILNAQKILEQNNITTSNEGALALAGFFKAENQNLPVGKFSVILLTGTKR